MPMLTKFTCKILTQTGTPVEFVLLSIKYSFFTLETAYLNLYRGRFLFSLCICGTRLPHTGRYDRSGANVSKLPNASMHIVIVHAASTIL